MNGPLSDADMFANIVLMDIGNFLYWTGFNIRLWLVYNNSWLVLASSMIYAPPSIYYKKTLNI